MALRRLADVFLRPEVWQKLAWWRVTTKLHAAVRGGDLAEVVLALA